METLQERFILNKHFVDSAYNGLEALEFLNKSEYDIVIMDHNMPEMTGLELIKQMKARGLKSKIIMITGYEELPEIGARVVGVDEYITKPIKLKEIENIIKKYAEGA